MSGNKPFGDINPFGEPNVNQPAVGVAVASNAPVKTNGLEDYNPFSGQNKPRSDNDQSQPPIDNASTANGNFSNPNFREAPQKSLPGQEALVRQQQKPLEAEHYRQIFVGGLTFSTSENGLKEFFEQYGDVVRCIVMRDMATKRSRGFGFVTFARSSMVDKAMRSRPHTIDGRTVESKRAVPKDFATPESGLSVKKLYVSGIKDDHTEEMLREYFGEFGDVQEVQIMIDRNTGKPRGFAFVLFSDYDPVDKACLQKSHFINDKRCDVKKALTEEEMLKIEQQTRDRESRGYQSRGDIDRVGNGSGYFGGGRGGGGPRPGGPGYDRRGGPWAPPSMSGGGGGGPQGQWGGQEGGSPPPAGGNMVPWALQQQLQSVGWPQQSVGAAPQADPSPWALPQQQQYQPAQQQAPAATWAPQQQAAVTPQWNPQPLQQQAAPAWGTATRTPQVRAPAAVRGYAPQMQQQQQVAQQQMPQQPAAPVGAYDGGKGYVSRSSVGTGAPAYGGASTGMYGGSVDQSAAAAPMQSAYGGGQQAAVGYGGSAGAQTGGWPIAQQPQAAWQQRAACDVQALTQQEAAAALISALAAVVVAPANQAWNPQQQMQPQQAVASWAPQGGAVAGGYGAPQQQQQQPLPASNVGMAGGYGGQTQQNAGGWPQTPVQATSQAWAPQQQAQNGWTGQQQAAGYYR